MTVECSTVEDRDGVLLAALSGRLGLADVAAVRLSLFKCLAGQPAALLVDLSGLSVGQPLALAVFAAVSRQSVRWPGIPMLLCAATESTGALLDTAALRRVPQFPTVEAAREQVAAYRYTLPSLTDELLPLSGAARQARNVVTDACLRWELPLLVGPASLIVSELVNNVVDHASTMATLRVSLGRHYLTIAVRDGSPVEPVRPGEAGSGRGLFLVETTAHSWGWLPATDGKVVWASLAT